MYIYRYIYIPLPLYLHISLPPVISLFQKKCFSLLKFVSIFKEKEAKRKKVTTKTLRDTRRALSLLRSRKLASKIAEAGAGRGRADGCSRTRLLRAKDDSEKLKAKEVVLLTIRKCLLAASKVSEFLTSS